MELVIFNLPEFAFLDGQCHDGDTLKDRDVVMHIRSASIVEFFDEGEINLNENVVCTNFVYKDVFGVEEKKICVLHYSQTLDNEFDIKEHILKPAIEWFKKYLDWQDVVIITEETVKLTAANN